MRACWQRRRVQVEWLRCTPNGCVPHHPIKAVNVLLAAISDAGMSDFYVADVAAMLERYLAQCGICERISRTPIPMPYTRSAPYTAPPNHPT